MPPKLYCAAHCQWMGYDFPPSCRAKLQTIYEGCPESI